MIVSKGLWNIKYVWCSEDVQQSYARRYKDSMAANNAGLGKLYGAFGGKQRGLEACVAVESLLEVNSIDTLLSNFILPLQENSIKTSDGRIHASLNINTETGRLSCRRPNLQNQPALEKDRYKVGLSLKNKIHCFSLEKPHFNGSLED